MYCAVIDGLVAQWLEQGTHNPLVPGSNPGGPSPESFRLLRRNEVAGRVLTLGVHASKTTAWQAIRI
jgi:hypothetical protein